MNIDDYTTMFNNLNAALAVANAEGDSVLEQKLLDAVNHMLHGMPTPTKDLAKLHIYQPTRRIDVDRFAQLLSIPVLYAYEYRIHGQQTRDEVEMWFPHDMRACMAYELSVYLDLDSHNIWFVWVFTPRTTTAPTATPPTSSTASSITSLSFVSTATATT